MKKTLLLTVISFFAFTAIAQEKINWLSTNDFEKAIKKGTKDFFIFIEDNQVNQNMPNMPKEREEQMQKMQKDMLAFLEDEKIVNYINKNFSCYKFSATAESVNFQGKEYKQTAEKGRSSHEFTFFLTETNRNNLPVIVLRDQNFNLFEYQSSIVSIDEMQILIDAERLKLNYLVEKLGKENQNVKKIETSLNKQSEELKRAQENKMSKSVFPAMQIGRECLKHLTYFSSDTNKKTDLKSYLQTK